MSALRQRLSEWLLRAAAWLEDRPVRQEVACRVEADPIACRTNAEIERWEAQMLRMPQVDCPLKHHFGPGVYVREMFAPKGTLVIGHAHNTEHLNIMLTGKARILVEGKVKEMTAPCIVTSTVGTRKAAVVVEDMRWLTIHPTPLRDVNKLEAELFTKSPVFRAWEQETQLKEN